MKLPFTLKAAEDLFLSLSVSLCLSTSLLVPNFVFSFVVVGVFFYSYSAHFALNFAFFFVTPQQFIFFSVCCFFL